MVLKSLNGWYHPQLVWREVTQVWWKCKLDVPTPKQARMTAEGEGVGKMMDGRMMGEGPKD